MKKALRIITHTDFDGIVPPFMIENLIKLDSKYSDFEIHVEYGDLINYPQIITNQLNLIENGMLKDTYLLLTDISDIGGIEIANRIDDLYRKGLNVLYMDHHPFEQSERFNEIYEWMYFCNDKTKCSSMQLYLLLIKYFSNLMGISNSAFMNDFLYINDEDIRIFLLHELNLLEKSPKLNTFLDFLNKLLEFDSSIESNENLKVFFSKLAKLVWGANLVDYRKRDQMEGLDYIADYIDIAVEYEIAGKNEILLECMNLLNSLPHSIETIKSKINEVQSNTKYDARVKESLNSILYFEILDNANNPYIAAVAFAEGDIRFKVEHLRFDLDNVFSATQVVPLNLDVFITFCRVKVLENPYFIIRPLGNLSDSLHFSQETKNDNIRIVGTPVGVTGQYNIDTYKQITALRKENINTDDYTIIAKNRHSIRELLENELKNIFCRVKQL